MWSALTIGGGASAQRKRVEAELGRRRLVCRGAAIKVRRVSTPVKIISMMPAVTAIPISEAPPFKAGDARTDSSMGCRGQKLDLSFFTLIKLDSDVEQTRCVGVIRTPLGGVPPPDVEPVRGIASEERA